MINHIRAILWKSLKDTIKNKTILIQFLMFPCLTIVMENAISIEGMPEQFFVNLFSTMYIGMAPLTSVASIISEEKEKNTLRVLQMSNVKAFEYLVSNAIYVVTVCMLGSLVMGLAGGYKGRELLFYLLIMLVGHFTSMLVGAALGAASKNQMMATSLTVPVMMAFSFIPMLAMFNEAIMKIAKYLFTEQLYRLINDVSELHIDTETAIILGVNIILVFAIFAGVYRKSFGK